MAATSPGAVVGEPRPLWPNPRTTQYGYFGKPPLPVLPPPSPAVGGQGWAQAWLQNHIDIQYQSVADKYFVGGSNLRWYFLTTDGWILSFWDGKLYDPRLARSGHMHPVGWLDLRTVHSVTWRMAMGGLSTHCPFEVLVHTRTGVFTFRVTTEEEARAWSQRLSAALVEWQMLEMQMMDRAQERAGDDRAAHAESGVVGKVIHQVAKREDFDLEDDGALVESPYRAEVLRRLWIQCLRDARRGETPTVFDEMFSLYDDNNDGTMQVKELEHLLQELVSVRRRELRRVVAGQLREDAYASLGLSQADLAAMMDLKQMARDLSNHYENMLRGEGFRARSLMLRAQLDTSRDERVSRGEFVLGAPELLLPGRELRLEVKFYEQVGQKMERDMALQGLADDDSEDEGGCIQQ